MSKRRRSQSSRSQSSRSQSSRSQLGKGRGGAFSVTKKRSGFRTFIETVMGVTAAILILAALYWWNFVRETPEVVESTEVTASAMKDNVIDSVASYESIRDRGNLGQLTRLLTELDNWRRDAETPVRLDTLSRRLEIAEKILEHPDIDEELRVSTAKKLLNAMGQYYGISITEGIQDDGTMVSRYLTICRDYVNDSNSEVAKEAHLSKAKVLVYELTNGEDGGSAQSIQETIADLITKYPNDLEIIVNIRGLIARVNNLDIRAGSDLNRAVVKQYGQLEITDPDVTRQLRDLKDLVLLEDSGISDFATEARTTGSYDKYLARLFELIDRPDTGIGFVNRAYDAIRYFEIVGKHDLAIKVINRLQESAAQRTNNAAKIQALRIAKFGLIRNELVGKKIDLNDTKSNGDPVDISQFEDRPCVIVFYSPNSADTSDMLRGLNFTYKLMSRTNVKIIAVAVEETQSVKFESGFDPKWISITSQPNSTPPKISNIFKQCPVSHVPYFVVVDKNGIVDAINVPASKLKTKIEALVATPGNTDNANNSNN